MSSELEGILHYLVHLFKDVKAEFQRDWLERLPRSWSVSGRAAWFIPSHHHFTCGRGPSRKEMARRTCLGMGTAFILLPPPLRFFYLIIVRFGYQNQPLETRKVNQLQYAILRKSPWKGFATFDYFSLRLHNTLMWFTTMNTNLIVGREIVGGSRLLALALRPILPLLCH